MTHSRLSKLPVAGLSLALLLVILHLLRLELTPFLEFNRSAIYQGQWWRILTGHFMHTNTWHLVMNLGGLFLIMLLHGNYYRAIQLWVNVVLGCLLIGLALLFWSPQISLYVGLSGWLHALLVCGCCIDIQRHWSSGWLILAAVFGKVIWEQWQGASQDIVTLINAEVATDAHLYGAAVGLFLYAVMLFVRRFAQAGEQTATN
ncbi:MAG: rhombosortase [Gammaproteobacteria bacterium]|nr:rhombosortase [Gammaproteobacteria bacterium]